MYVCVMFVRVCCVYDGRFGWLVGWLIFGLVGCNDWIAHQHHNNNALNSTFPFAHPLVVDAVAAEYG